MISDEEIGKELKNSKEAYQLFTEIAKYFRNKSKVDELASVVFEQVYKFNMSFEVAQVLLNYMFRTGKASPGYFRSVAIDWSESGITTKEDANLVLECYENEFRRIASCIGVSGKISGKRMKYLLWWIKNFDVGLILEACDRAALSQAVNRFAYADGILKDWDSRGISCPDQIPLKDVKPEKSKKIKEKSEEEDPTRNINYDKNRFNRFKQHDYDFDEIEKILLSQ